MTSLAEPLVGANSDGTRPPEDGKEKEKKNLCCLKRSVLEMWLCGSVVGVEKTRAFRWISGRLLSAEASFRWQRGRWSDPVTRSRAREPSPESGCHERSRFCAVNIDAGADRSVSSLCALAAFSVCACGRRLEILSEDVGGNGRFFVSLFSGSVVKCLEA